MSNLYLESSFLKAEIARLIEANPELSEDEVLRADMIDGETEIAKIMAAVLNELNAARTMAVAIKSRENELQERRGRFERREASMRSLMRNIMRAADLDKIMLTEATLSIMKPRTSVNVIDVEALPQGFFKIRKDPDKTALKAALEAGERIPGAELALGDETLMIRVK
ncbi:MAG: siphovirus Gp157 family protein [Patescibacteria group bacterium]|nr:siphovirus Gp157 family protein [Patescibacteria group bacterium]